MSKISTASTMTLDGGSDCLDFINSGYDVEKGRTAERLHCYDDLLTLAERLELFDSACLDTLRRAATRSKKAADQALKFALDCRQKLSLLFAALARHELAQLDSELMAELNRLFAEAAARNLLQVKNGELKFSFQPARGDLLSPVWRLLLSAYDLLRSANLQHIKECPRCSWLFIDRTKNHGRKWCSMESCGNAQKTKRYYELQKVKP